MRLPDKGLVRSLCRHETAKIAGPHATPKGLRHGFGGFWRPMRFVCCALKRNGLRSSAKRHYFIRLHRSFDKVRPPNRRL